MNNAIKLAIEKGGYEIVGNMSRESLYLNRFQIFQDPLFWRALGKALDVPETKFNGKPAWFVYAMQYHELNLTGGDTEKFLKELITHD